MKLMKKCVCMMFNTVYTIQLSSAVTIREPNCMWRDGSELWQPEGVVNFNDRMQYQVTPYNYKNTSLQCMEFVAQLF